MLHQLQNQNKKEINTNYYYYIIYYIYANETEINYKILRASKRENIAHTIPHIISWFPTIKPLFSIIHSSLLGRVDLQFFERQWQRNWDSCTLLSPSDASIHPSSTSTNIKTIEQAANLHDEKVFFRVQIPTHRNYHSQTSAIINKRKILENMYIHHITFYMIIIISSSQRTVLTA